MCVGFSWFKVDQRWFGSGPKWDRVLGPNETGPRAQMGSGPIGSNLIWARGPISFQPGAESPLINFESSKFVPTMDGHECKPNTHTWPPWILKHPIYQPFHLSSKFNSMLRVAHRDLAPCRIGPKMMTSSPQFLGYNSWGNESISMGFSPFDRYWYPLSPHSNLKENRRCRLQEN